MKKILIVALAAAGTLVTMPAVAASATWTFSGWSSTTGAYGNVLSDTSGGVQVNATAWSDTGFGNTLQTAYLGVYGGNLGVTNRAEDGSEPNHAVDNENQYDSILLSFNSAVNLTSVKNGYSYNDSDMSVLAYIGSGTPPVLAGQSYADLIGNGWTNIASLSNPGTSPAATGSSTYSSYWLVGAFNPTFDSANANWGIGKDYVKLYAATGTICAGTATGGSCGGQPGSSVAEPGSLALAGLGLLGVIGLRRRRS